MLSTTITRTLATTLSGAAIATAGAPVASAMPIDPVGPPGEPGAAPIEPIPRASASAHADTAPGAGFDLSSAAIGAAGGGLLIVVLAAGGLAWRRPETHGHGAVRA